MADDPPTAGAATDGPRLDVRDEGALREWSRRLDATPDELREAVAAVGDRLADVELHLKGSRSSINSERVRRNLNAGR